MIRRTLLWFCIGALLGLVASMWWGPRLLGWWATPSAKAQTVWSADDVRSVLAHFVEIQIATCVMVGVVTSVLANLFGGRKKPAAAAPAGSPR